MSTLSFPFLRAIETKRPAATPRHAPRDLAPLPANLTAERVLDVQHYGASASPADLVVEKAFVG